MAIVVDMGGGNPLEGAMQGMAGFAQGYQQAVDQEEQREELRRQRDREEEKHTLAMEQAARAQSLIDAQEQRDIADWERGRAWDVEDRERDKKRRKGDRRRLELQERRDRTRFQQEQTSWSQGQEDRKRRLEIERSDREYFVKNRDADESILINQREVTNAQLEKTMRLLQEEVAGDEGQKRAALSKLRNNKLALRYEREDWDAITKAFKTGGLDAGMTEANRVNNRVIAMMDKEAYGKLLGVGDTPGLLDRALASGDISEEQYLQATDTLGRYDRGEEVNVDGMLVDVTSIMKAGRKRRTARRNHTRSLPLAQELFDQIVGAESFNPDQLTDAQAEALAEAEDMLQQLEDGAAGQPGERTAASLLSSLRRNLQLAQPMTEEQQRIATQSAEDLNNAQDEIAQLKARNAELERQVATGSPQVTQTADPAATPDTDTPTGDPAAPGQLTGNSINDLPVGANAEEFRGKGEDAWLEHINGILKSYGKQTHDNIEDAFSAYNDLREEAERVHDASEKEKAADRSELKERVQSGPGGWRY